MKNKALWPIVASWISLLIVSASCAPSAPAQGSTPTLAARAQQTAAAPPTAASQAQATAAPAAEAPKYGGTIISVLNADPANFDTGAKAASGQYIFGFVYQQLMTTDWNKGPAGGGPADYYLAGASSLEDMQYPELAESWKTPSPGVWVFQIRRGVHWQKVDSEAGRLMGGRELTADDVAASFKRLLTAPTSWIVISQPAVTKATTIEKTGDWEVTLKTSGDYVSAFLWLIQGGIGSAVYPPDVVTKYGDVADWHNAVGTGPFILADYAKGSSLTFIKNPDYWEKDPVGAGKGNKLPYVDQQRQLIIPDASTRLASLRTGKIDMLIDASREDAQSITKDNPKMLSQHYMNNITYGIGMRTDKQDLPFKDKRVRQAMMLATDFNSLKKTLYGDDAEIDVWPVNNLLKTMYLPLAETPPSVQDLFKYNPDKAKQLLAEAGYPNGFKTTVATSNDPQLVDELSVYKSMWAKVGIDLTIDPREASSFTAFMLTRQQEQLLYRPLATSMSVALAFMPYRGPSTSNPSYIDDPVGSVPEIDSIYKEVTDNVFVNWPRTYSAFKKLKPVLLENAYVIPRPTPYIYTLWWPWVKNYYGMQTTAFARYAWVDQDLKKSMGR